MIKGSIQEYITFVNICASNIAVSKYKANINKPEGRNGQKYKNRRECQYFQMWIDSSERKSIRKRCT